MYIAPSLYLMSVTYVLQPFVQFFVVSGKNLSDLDVSAKLRILFSTFMTMPSVKSGH